MGRLVCAARGTMNAVHVCPTSGGVTDDQWFGASVRQACVERADVKMNASCTRLGQMIRQLMTSSLGRYEHLQAVCGATEQLFVVKAEYRAGSIHFEHI
jgi:hypothetical protein